MNDDHNLPADWRPVAFKEWSTVCDALANGEQSLILRKGGISEGKLGFQWLHERFFLFPTFFHTQLGQVKGERAIREPREDGRIALQLIAEVTESGRLTDWDEITALADEHIWTEEAIRERYEWGDEPGISFARVTVRQLSEPWVLDDRKGFGGCRSWIGLPAEEGGDWRTLADSAEPLNL